MCHFRLREGSEEGETGEVGRVTGLPMRREEGAERNLVQDVLHCPMKICAQEALFRVT